MSAQKKFLDLIIIYLCACAVFGVLQSANPYLTSGFDSYYHLKMPLFIAEHGILDKFPWLRFTVLSEHFYSHHLLFHLLMLPLLKILPFDTIVAGKIISVLFASLVFPPFYLLLRRNMKPGMALALTLVAIFSLPLTYYSRHSMLRSYTIAGAVMLYAIGFMFDGKRWQLAVLAAFFALLYGGFFFLPIMAAIFWGCQLFYGRKADHKTLAAVFLGTAAGVLLHPNASQTYEFLNLQVNQAGFNSPVPSGSEWRPFSTQVWMQMSLSGLGIFGLSLLLTLRQNFKISFEAFYLLLCAIFWSALSFVANRFLEYQPLFLLLAGLYHLPELLTAALKEKTGFAKALQPIGLVLIVALFYQNYTQLNSAYAKNTNMAWNNSDIKAGMEWLKQNSNQGELLFADSWDVFPVYFFYNDWNHYITGLDPNFMRKYNPLLYQKYNDITSGKQSTNLTEVQSLFGARFVASMPRRRRAMYNNFLADKEHFELAYSGSEVSIFKLKEK